MTQRKTYEVSPHPDGWQGKVQGGQRASVVTPTKVEATRETTSLAKNHDGPSQVIIKGADGRIQSERTYRQDPYPPKG